MDKILVWLVQLPPSCRGLTVQDENGDYNIYLNPRLNYETQKETLLHELEHIKKQDFDSLEHVNLVEKY